MLLEIAADSLDFNARVFVLDGPRGGRQHADDDYRTENASRLCAGARCDPQRRRPANEGKRGHQDWTQAQTSALERSFNQLATFLEFRFGKLDNQDRILRGQTNEHDQSNLRDLFGEPERWGQTLRNMLWTHASVVAPSFQDSASIDLPVPCTFDFNVAATKYFQGLSGGEVPLIFLFSGTVFYADADGSLQVAPIPWDKEAHFRLPVKDWNEMMDIYYPNTAWLCLRRDVFRRLYQYKVTHGIPTWEQALEKMLAVEEVTQ